MTQDPTAPHAKTTQLAEKSQADTDDQNTQKLSEVPSKMVALLHKALQEQKHDEADHRHEFEEDQKDLKQQEAATKKRTIEKMHEDPNMELARYIEEEEEKKTKQAHKSQVKVDHHSKLPAQGSQDSKSGAGAHTVQGSDSLPGDSSLDSEVRCHV